MGRLLKNLKDTSRLKKYQELLLPVLLLGIAILCTIGLKLHLVALSMPYLWAERLFFTILAILSMIFMGVMVFRVYGEHFLLFLVPLILIFNGSYLNFSHQFLNVTIIDSFLVTLLYLYLFTFLLKDTVFYRVFIPGVLTGIALAANSHLFPLVLPSILVIFFYSRKQRIVKILLLMSVTLVTLFLMIPLSFFLFVHFNILDFNRYSIHLKEGVFQGDGLFYWRTLLKDFGIGSIVFVFLGLLTAFKKDWKRSSILISFPFIFLVFMGTRGPRFAPLPEVLSVYLFYSIFAAVGILGLYRLLQKMGRYLLPFKLSQGLKHSIVLLIVSILFVFFFPVTRAVRQWVAAKPDSRKQAVKWIQSNIQPGASLVIPGELEMDAQSLKKDYHIFTRDFKNLKRKTFENLAVLLDHPFFLVPEYSCYGKNPVAERDLKVLGEFRGKMVRFALFGTNNVLRNYYCPLPSGNPRFSIGQMKEEPVKLIDKCVVWNPKAEPVQGTSPSMITLFKKGEFTFHFTGDKMGNILDVRNRKADKEGSREIAFGYEINRKGFDMEMPEGKYIHLVVNAAILPFLNGSKNNFVYISDFSGGLKSGKVFFSSPGWRTYIVSRKVRQGAARLVLGFRFTPGSEEERLKIRHINIFLSDEPL